jgi:hypothetical protein
MDLPEQLEPGQRVRVSAEVENRLAPGRYVVKLWIHRERNFSNLVLFSPHILDFVVFGTEEPGMVFLDSNVSAVVEGES